MDSSISNRSKATSVDGTEITYRSVGSGPAIVLVHGAFESVDSHSDLAIALSSEYTAVTYSRRGRGENPSIGEHFSMQTEVDDLEALLDATGANIVFGVSSGALICLEASKQLPKIHKAVLFEPVLLIDDSFDDSFIDRHKQEIEDNRPEAALVTAMLGTQMGPGLFNYFPRRILDWMTKRMMEKEEQKAKPGDITLRMHAPTIAQDFQIVREMAGPLDRFKDVSTQILLLRGSKSPEYLRNCLPPLEKTLQNARLVEMPGADHSASGNKDFRGKPDVVAKEILAFLNS